MKLKNILLLVLPFLFTTLSFGQKCKYDIDETDHFTGVSRKGNTINIFGTTSSGGKKFSSLNYWEFTVLKTKKEYTVELTFQVNGVMEDEIQIGDSLFLAFTDASPVSFVVTTSSSPVAEIYLNEAATRYSITTACTEATLQKMTQNTPRALRIKIGNRYWTKSFGKPIQKKFAKVIPCMLELQ